jgi:hypothetical protein
MGFEDTRDGTKVMFNFAENSQLHQQMSSFLIQKEVCRLISYAFKEFGFEMEDIRATGT